MNLRATARRERSVADTAYEASGDSLRETREARFGGEAYETEVHDRLALPSGRTVSGPAVLEQAESTAVVPPEWAATVRGDGTVVLSREGER